MVNGYDQTDYVGHGGGGGGGGYSYQERMESRSATRSGGASRKQQSRKELTEFEVAKLIANAPPGSVKQSINVEREEEEILGPLPLNHADGSASGPDGLLNFDTISEKVDLGIEHGWAQLAVKVRCERVVPIRGVEDMFKKSSVIVTRLIEIDLQATPERKELLENILRGSSRPMIDDVDVRSHGRRHQGRDARLTTKDTFKLYKTFMGIAEADDGRTRRTMIEKRLEDENKMPEQAEFDFPTEGITEDDAFGDEIQMIF